MGTAQQLLLRGAVAGIDPYYSSVVMLSHFDGSNGDAPPWTNNYGSGTGSRFGDGTAGGQGGSPALSTTQTKFGATSAHFDGSSYAFTASDANYGFGTGDFTIEFILYYAANQTKNVMGFGTGGFNVPVIYTDTSGVIYWYEGNTNRITSGSSALNLNAWNEVCYCKVSGTGRLFVRGSQVGSDYADSNNYNNMPLAVGATPTGGSPMTGYIDEFRVTKGVGRYSANYTVASAAFPDS